LRRPGPLAPAFLLRAPLFVPKNNTQSRPGTASAARCPQAVHKSIHSLLMFHLQKYAQPSEINSFIRLDMPDFEPFSAPRNPPVACFHKIF
jgi:hypothetical protein